MNITDEKLLAEMRLPGRCEHCQVWCDRREPAHIKARGQNSNKRFDVRINLASLGPAFKCGCHARSHNGLEPTTGTLLRIVAKRERTTVPDIKAVMDLLMRLPKNQYVTPERVRLELDDLEGSARALAEKTLDEAKVEWREEAPICDRCERPVGLCECLRPCPLCNQKGCDGHESPF